MPTYDYRCIQCGNTVEIFHSMQESPKIACGLCGGFTQRAIHQAPLILKNGSQPPPHSENSENTGEHGHQCGPTCAMHMNLDALIKGAPENTETEK